MLQDYKLGLRMLVKYPGLSIVGGLALAVAIGMGAGWHDLWGKILSPSIPLPEGERIVTVETRNLLTNEAEPRVARDFLEWRRELRTIEGLGAYRTITRNVSVGDDVPRPIQVAELTAAAFRTARVSPILGRTLLDSDESSGASVVVIGYDLWQRSLGGRPDVVGTTVTLGSTRVTVVGVMPDGFGYPINHKAWTPLRLHASYGALEGGALGVIGRLAPGVMLTQADAELRLLGERAAAVLPATHEHLRPRVMRLGHNGDITGFAEQIALTNLPVLMGLLIACLNVGTLVYARTATREGEIAVRSALGASRARIVGQLFVETLILSLMAAGAGLLAADRILRWGVEMVWVSGGGAPFWMVGGLTFTTILYAVGLAVVSAAILSLLPALRATRSRLQSHLANLATGGATLRFGRVWTTAMIVQVALTAMAIPAAMESTSQTTRNRRIRAEFPSQEYLVARLDLDRPEDGSPSASAARRVRALADLEQRLAQEPGVIGVTHGDRVPGSTPPGTRIADIEISPGAGPAFDYGFRTSEVGPRFFEVFGRPIVAGRAFQAPDWGPTARAVIVNEAFVRGFQRRGGGSPIGARLRYSARPGESATEPWFEIAGVVRNFDLDPDDEGNERAYVFHAAPAETIDSLVISVHIRGNPARLAARLPAIAADVDAGLYVQQAQSLNEWVGERDRQLIRETVALAVVTTLVLFLSAMGIYSLLSVSVSRRTREIGLRAALGANPRHVLAEIASRAMALMGSGFAIGGAFLMFLIVLQEESVTLFLGWLALTCGVMLAAGVVACVEPARRALRINPIDALREG